MSELLAKGLQDEHLKFHLAVDARGNPITFIITDGTTQDVKIAPDLIGDVDLDVTAVIYSAKGYDSYYLLEHI